MIDTPATIEKAPRACHSEGSNFGVHDFIEQFRQAIAAVGLPAPDVIHGDGAIHRFSTNGRRGNDSGCIALYTTRKPHINQQVKIF